MRDAGGDFCMVFVGDGQDRPAVEEYAAQLGLTDLCRFTGTERDRDTIRAWYTRADLLLFPSTFDTNGLVVREAAACSLGSVLIEGSCAAEGITDGDTGIPHSRKRRRSRRGAAARGRGPRVFRPHR